MGALGAIEAALDSRDAAALERAVDDFIVTAEPIEQADIDRVCDRLRLSRHFTQLIRVADAGIQRGRGGQLWGDLMQCLIEHGAYTAAVAVSERALEEADLPPQHRNHLLGLTGRVSKDLYVATGQDDHLVRAIRAYERGFVEGDDDQKLWLGINAHALAHLARRRGVDVGELAVESASDFMARATAAAASGDPWAIATEVEAHLLLGLPVPVDTIATRLADADPFVHASLRRQLLEIWQLGDDHRATVTLAELLLRDGGTGEVVLPADKEGYEKIFGSEWPIPIETYRQGLHVAASVCHLLVDETFPAGTGFVVDGGELHAALAGRPVLLTNEHVIPTLDRDGVRGEEVVAKFDAHDLSPIGGFRAIWWSDREDLDVTILVSDDLATAGIEPLEPSGKLPSVRDGAHVYVVGHPGGAGLQLSIRGNDLIDHDGTRLHYKAPTSRGSSGSPVFDHTWKLIGVHHRGSATLDALNGKPGRYEGNEGTSIVALRERLTERAPEP